MTSYFLLGQISSEIIQKQNTIFNEELKRQQNAVGRIEKINVVYKGLPEEAELIMNKNLSTPYNCAQRKYTNFSSI